MILSHSLRAGSPLGTHARAAKSEYQIAERFGGPESDEEARDSAPPSRFAIWYSLFAARAGAPKCEPARKLTQS